MLQEHVNSANLTTNAKTSTNTIINLHPEAYFTIIYHSLSYANKGREKNDWLEVMGWVSGTVSHSKGIEIVNITKAWPVTHGTAVGVSINNYGKILDMIMLELSKNKSSILGWYHSHPSFGLFMSQTDFETQKSYQRLYEKSVALVFDHTIWSSINAGIEAYRLLSDHESFEKISIHAANDFSMDLNIPLYHLFMDKIRNNNLIKELELTNGGLNQ